MNRNTTELRSDKTRGKESFEEIVGKSAKQQNKGREKGYDFFFFFFFESKTDPIMKYNLDILIHLFMTLQYPPPPFFPPPPPPPPRAKKKANKQTKKINGKLETFPSAFANHTLNQLNTPTHPLDYVQSRLC